MTYRNSGCVLKTHQSCIELQTHIIYYVYIEWNLTPRTEYFLLAQIKPCDVYLHNDYTGYKSDIETAI